jgi:predicted peroxiredoxin
MKMLYIVNKGTADPTGASVPFHIAANGSVEEGQEVSVVLAGDATELVVAERAQEIEGLGMPPLRDLLSKLREHEVPVYV